jgi:GT2 family glycosyltransferase
VARSVLAVVLNWNRPEQVRICVEHLRATTTDRPDILIIDNGSTAENVARLRADQAGERIVALPENLGFAGGMNVGIQDALARRYDYVWLVNDDAYVAPECLTRLLDRLERDPALMLVTPRLLYGDGAEQHAGGIVCWRDGTLRPLSAAELESPQPDGAWLAGAAILARTSSLDRTGGFDPAFFAYWEDVDLSLRTTRRGGRLAAVPDAVATHTRGATSGGDRSPFVEFLLTRNTWLFLERHATAGRRFARWLRYAASAIERAKTYEREGDTASARATLAGVTAARRGEYGAPPREFGAGTMERYSFKAAARSVRTMRSVADWLG